MSIILLKISGIKRYLFFVLTFCFVFTSNFSQNLELSYKYIPEKSYVSPVAWFEPDLDPKINKYLICKDTLVKFSFDTLENFKNALYQIGNTSFLVSMKNGMVRKTIKLSKNLYPDICDIVEWKIISKPSDEVIQLFGETNSKTKYKLKYKSERHEMAMFNEVNHGFFDLVFYKDFIIDETIRNYEGEITERKLLFIEKSDKQCKNLIEAVTMPFSDDVEIGLEDLYNFSFH